MDKNKVAKKDGRVRRTNDVVEVQRTYISPDYDLTLYSGREIGTTGRLDIGTLRPCEQKAPPLPWFGLRWDEKDTAIDIDPYDCPAREHRLFVGDALGYSGHHTRILDEPERVTDWKLVWKGECLYHGKIRCSVLRDMELGGTLKPVGTLTYVLRKQCSDCGTCFEVVGDETLCPNCRSMSPSST